MGISKKNTLWIPKYFFSFIIALSLVTLVFQMFGIFWEESFKIAPTIIYGQVCAQPYQAWFIESFLFQPPILAKLSAIFMTVPVVGLWHFFLLWVYVYLAFLLSFRVAGRWVGHTIWRIVGSILFCIALIGTSFIYIHLDREAILLMALSALLHMDYYVYDGRRHRFLILTFFLGCLMRSSLGLFVMVMISLLALLHFRSLGRFLRLYWIQWFIVLACLSIVVLYKFSAGNTGVLIEQSYEYATFIHDVVPLSTMKSAQDSVRYEALTSYFFITDSAQIKMDFIKRVVDVKKMSSMNNFSEDWEHLSNSLLPILHSAFFNLFLFYLLLMICMWHSDKKTWFNIVLINAFCWLVIIVISMKIGMYERFLFPWIAMMFASSFLLASLQNGTLLIIQKKGMLIILIALCLLTGLQIKRISLSEQAYNKSTAGYLGKIKMISETQIPVIWDYSQVYFPTDIFYRKETQCMDRCIYQTLYFSTFFSFGQQRSIDKLGVSPLDWRNLGHVFMRRKDICFVLPDRVATFLPQYYKSLYGINFVLEKDIPEKEICPDNFVYHLRHVK
jgi:hypothetical protein